MSECCSCNTMRGEDEGCETTRDNPHYQCNQKAFNGRCLEKLVNASDGAEYSSGTFVWTLFDYYGEPPKPGWSVSSTYGQFDLCGFPKSAAFWFRSQWLLDGNTSNSTDKPFPTDGMNQVHIVESWESPNNWNETRGNKTRSIHAYSNAPVIELLLNGKSQGSRSVHRMVHSNNPTYAEWEKVPWEAGELTAVARLKDGTVVAKATKATNTEASRLELALDCPSPMTGTGDSLFLDGQDVALIRATIVDSIGQTVHFSTHNVTFKVLNGPGVIVGTANGDSKSYQPHDSSSQTAFHGLVRAVVRVTSMAGLSKREKILLQEIDRPSFAFKPVVLLSEDADDIVVEASTPGLAPSQLVIPTSTNKKDSVLSVASHGAGKPVDFFNGNK
mmetsp:Transcript_13907/g.24923  ORF Transcript_13907/g.24923 Transcript_13907/m.24923 type:complete len:387 (+) Transcript_13907:74-1234(+)